VTPLAPIGDAERFELTIASPGVVQYQFDFQAPGTYILVVEKQ
jgi:hypothetical protein